MLATCPQQVVRVGLVEFGERHDTRTNEPHYTAADRWPTNQVSSWQTGCGGRPTPDTRDILVAYSQGCRVCRSVVSARMRRGICPRGIPATNGPHTVALSWSVINLLHTGAHQSCPSRLITPRINPVWKNNETCNEVSCYRSTLIYNLMYINIVQAMLRYVFLSVRPSNVCLSGCLPMAQKGAHHFRAMVTIDH